MILAQAGEDVWIKLIGSVGGAGCLLLLGALFTRRVLLWPEHAAAIEQRDARIKSLETALQKSEEKAEKWQDVAFQAVAAAKQSSGTAEKAMQVATERTAP